MAGIFKALKDFFSYKPKKAEPYEFLENSNEGENNQSISEQQKAMEKDKRNQSSDENKQSGESQQNDDKQPESNQQNQNNSQYNLQVSTTIQNNLQIVRDEFNIPRNQDVIIREFLIAHSIKAFILFIDGMVDKPMINDIILRELMNSDHFKNFSDHNPIDFILNNVLSINQIKRSSDCQSIILQVLGGMTALFVDGCCECLLIETRGFEKRAVEQPVAETVIGGPQEAFTENLRTNITLVRRIIKNKDLITEIFPVGKTNNNNCAILYLDGIVNPEIVTEVKRRLSNIDTDFIEANGTLGQLIEDNPFDIFPDALYTERPDRTASFIMEGEVAIITDGTPASQLVPVTFFHMFHTSEDSILRWQYGTFLRLIRLFGLFIAILLPGLYVALNLYHTELIPTELLSAIGESRERVPFPLVFELLIMEFSFELIREAGLRVPGVIGNTLGIIGALILGQAAVAANLVSPILIIIVAITGLGNFAMPNYQLALGIRITRFIFIIMGAIAGFYGISIGIFIVGTLLCSMKSFGMPFLSPVAPRLRKSHDLIIRQPTWRQELRPDITNTINTRRQPDESKLWAASRNKGDKNDKSR